MSCRFRNQRGSPDSPSYDFQARNPLKIKSETPPYSSNLSSILNSPITENVKAVKRRFSSPESSQEPSSHFSGTKNIASPTVSAKRQRSSLPGPNDSKVDRKSRSLKGSQTAPESRSDIPNWDASLPKANVKTFHWDFDPCVIDKELTIHCVDKYFTYVNNTTYRMFPPGPFQDWVSQSERKSPGERMALYAMLAVGSVFTDDSTYNKQGPLLARIAQDAAEKSQGEFTLQLVHCRLLLSLYYIALAQPRLAWDYAGAAIRAASGLEYNLENGCQGRVESEGDSYGLNQFALAECRRRCFWTVFMIDVGRNLRHPVTLDNSHFTDIWWFPSGPSANATSRRYIPSPSCQ